MNVIYYMREQLSYLCADYVQQVKRHACTEYPERYIEEKFANIDILKYESLYDDVSKVCGQSNTIARVYEDQKDLAGGIFGGFAGLFDLDMAKLTIPRAPVNVSLGPRDIAIMLLINRFQPRMRFSDYIAADAAQFRGARAFENHDEYISAALRQDIRCHFQAENQAVAKKLFGRDSLFETQDHGRYLPIDTDNISPQDIVNFFGALVTRYDRRLARLEQAVQHLIESSNR